MSLNSTTLTTVHPTPNPEPAVGLSKLTLRGTSPTNNDDKENYNLSTTATPGPDYTYAQFLPSFNKEYKLPPLEPFEHTDPGLAALKDSNPREFLKGAKETVLSPKFGSEIEGLQLSGLDSKAKGQLALYVAQRGVVVFRDQDFVDQSPEWQLEDWGSAFGRLHTHPTSGQPAAYPQFHLVYRDGATAKSNRDTLSKDYYADRLTSTQWHSDVTYELQPPGLTTLFLYATPESGGDTAFVSQVEAYNRLSVSFRTYLETLSVVHSGVEQANFAISSGGHVKREPVEHVHPLVRRHPVTGDKALFINKGFSRRIVGLKLEESEAILNLLYAHIAQGHDFQVRASWKPRTVVLWDNRITAHSATGDFDPSKDGFRHGARITPQAERPFL